MKKMIWILTVLLLLVTVSAKEMCGVAKEDRLISYSYDIDCFCPVSKEKTTYFFEEYVCDMWGCSYMVTFTFSCLK